MVNIKGIASPHSAFCTCTTSGEPRRTHDDVWVHWAWLETLHLRLPDSSPFRGACGERVTLPCVVMTPSARGLSRYHAHFHSDVAALQKLWFVDTLVTAIHNERNTETVILIILIVE